MSATPIQYIFCYIWTAKPIHWENIAYGSPRLGRGTAGGATGSQFRVGRVGVITPLRVRASWFRAGFMGFPYSRVVSPINNHYETPQKCIYSGSISRHQYFVVYWAMYH